MTKIGLRHILKLIILTSKADCVPFNSKIRLHCGIPIVLLLTSWYKPLSDMICVHSGGSRIFPRGVRQLPKLLLFFIVLLKTAWKWKNLDPGGGASLAPPLDPPMVHDNKLELKSLLPALNSQPTDHLSAIITITLKSHAWLVLLDSDNSSY